MIDASGAIGFKHWQGRRSRQRTEKWIEEIIEQVRNSQLEVPEDSALYCIANHRDLEGELLDKHTAAKVTLNFFTQSLQYNVPKQNLQIGLSKMPTSPKSGFIINLSSE